MRNIRFSPIDFANVGLSISVIGTGYLGAVDVACMADLGHTVVGVDTDPAKVGALNAGVAPLFEPGLDELLERLLPTGGLRFTTDRGQYADALCALRVRGDPPRSGASTWRTPVSCGPRSRR